MRSAACIRIVQMQEEDNCCRVCFRGVYSCHWKLSSNSEGRVSVCRHAEVESLTSWLQSGISRTPSWLQRPDALPTICFTLFLKYFLYHEKRWDNCVISNLIKCCDEMLAADDNRGIHRSKQVSCEWKGCLVVDGGSSLRWSASKSDAIKSMKTFWNSI